MLALDVETKLAAARTRLILDKPFLGALVLRLPLVAARPDWCRTTSTDARKLYYNAQYIEHLSLAETQFVLAQEALHCALSHFARRGHRIPHLWDLACDFAINPILVQDGLTAPPGAFYDHNYEGMTAEEIYPFLLDNENDSSHEENLHDRPEESEGGQGDQPPPPDQEQDEDADQGQAPQTESDPEQPSPDGTDEEQEGAHKPPPLSEQERETLEVQWKQRLAGAAQQAMQAGRLSPDLARLVDGLLEPKLPWRSLLAHYMSARARDDYSYTRPSTRRGEPAILPSLRSQQLDVVVALDSSGSISAEEMNAFVAEVDALKGQIRARVVLHACDRDLSPGGPWIFETWEPLVMPSAFHGGGGTDFRPIFEWVETLDREPDLLVYFTDAEGRFPQYPPHHPVIWLVKGKASVPWGQRIQLN